MKSLLFLFVLWLSTNTLISQHSTFSVVLEGNVKYRQSYLFDLIESDDADSLEEETIINDAQILRNLAGTQSVEYQLDTLGRSIELTFSLKERITLLPIVGFGGVKNNLYFQLGIADLNFLGRGHQFSTYYQNNDRRNNLSLYYRAQRLVGSPWGISVGLLRLASVEPLFFDTSTVFYDYDNLSAGVTVIRRFGNNIFLEAGGTFFVENYGKNARHEFQTTPGPEGLRQPKYLGKFVANFNFLKYNSFYLEGFESNSIFQSVYNPGDLSWFQVFQSDLRYFLRFRKAGNLALRARIGIASNHDSPFAPFVLDSYVNIRGVGNRVDRGTATVILNAEYRQTIFDRSLFAGQIVGFSDLGSWRKPGGEFSDILDTQNFRQFAGIGARLIFKRVFNAVLRVDYGFDLFDTSYSGVVLGIGQYF